MRLLALICGCLFQLKHYFWEMEKILAITHLKRATYYVAMNQIELDLGSFRAELLFPPMVIADVSITGDLKWSQAPASPGHRYSPGDGDMYSPMKCVLKFEQEAPYVG